MRPILLALLLAFPAYADIINVPASGTSTENGDDLAAALLIAACGDTIVLEAGGIYDGTFALTDEGCSEGMEITITSDEADMLPMDRVGPSDAAHMAKLRVTGTNADHFAVFYAANSSSDWWILDGLEITDNLSGSNTAILIENGNAANNWVIQRNYIHTKEVGTSDYERNVRFATQWEGSGLTYKWNYCDGIIGYYESTFTMIDTACFMAVGGNTITMEDNYISSWYVGFFLGGGDTLPQNTASITSSDLDSGTFDNVTGISAGMVLRFDFAMTGTAATSMGVFTVTRTGGATMTSADELRWARITEVGGSGLTGMYELTDVTGSVYTYEIKAGSAIPDGSVTLTMYEMAMVTSVVGSTVNYTPFGIRALVQAPTAASWNYGNQGLVHTINVTHNTFYIDPVFAEDAILNNGSHPKGYWEIKNCSDMLIEGNYLSGFRASFGWTGSNQNGSAPWSVVQNVTMQYNWVEELTTIIVTDNQYTNTTQPANHFDFNNNVIKRTRNVFQGGGGGIQAEDSLDTFSFTHNTVINNAGEEGGYSSIMGLLGPILNFTFNDNIFSYLGNGIQCFVDPFTLDTCTPSGREILNNVAADTESAGFATNVWGSGSVLSPIPADFDEVGFTNLAGDDYELTALSDFKGAATDMTDPGVDWDALLSALGGSPVSSTGGRVKVRAGIR